MRDVTPDELGGSSKAAVVIGPFGSSLKTSDFADSGVPLIFVRDIRAGDFSKPRAFVSEEKARDLRAHIAIPGDIVVTKMGDPPGDVAVYDGPVPAVITADCIRLRPAHGYDTRYLLHAFKTPQVRQQVLGITSGAAQKKVSLERFRHRVAVPVPSLPEQRRIAAILDQAEALRAKRREVLTHLDSLTRSIFKDIVGGDYWRSVSASATGPNEAGWSWVPLSDISRLATGHTPDRKRPDYWDGGKIPWISLPEIRSLDGQTATRTDLAITEAGLANSSAVLLPVGTVCFSRTASVGFVTKLGVPMATSQDFHNWVPGPGLDGEYLMSALRYSRRHLLSVSDGSIHRTIYQRTAQTFRVLLPPLDLQHEFTEQAKAVTAQRVAVQRALATDDELFASLQSRAFRGEL